MLQSRVALFSLHEGSCEWIEFAGEMGQITELNFILAEVVI